MVKWRRTPAIFAGLAGSAVWSVPVLTQAAPADEVLVTMNDLLASPVAYFFVGLATGAVVTGVAVGAAGHHSRKRLSRQLDEARAASEGLVIHVSTPGVVLDLTGEGVPAPVGDETGSEGDTAKLARERLDSTASLARAKAPAPQAAPVAKPRVTESVPQLEDIPSFTGPLHVRRALDGRLPGFGGSVGGSVVPTAAQASAQAPASRQAGASEGPQATAGEQAEPSSTGRAAEAPASPVRGEAAGGVSRPSAAAPRDHGQDYERIAEEYVKESKAAERQKRKSRGVRAILSERLHSNVMEGLPVIERADGSTTDIGTSWWTKEVGSTHSFATLDPSTTADLPPVTEAPDPMSTSALRQAELIRAERNAQAAGFSGSLGLQRTGAPAPAAPAASAEGNGGDEGDTARLYGTRRAAAIADRLSSVDMSLYPEERISSQDADGDMFEQALRAMDEQDAAASVTTSGESKTDRVPLTGELQAGAVVSSGSLGQAGREREVEEHVDYLVRDELERNRARHNQRTAHSILTVFDGTGDLSDVRRGRHFSQPEQPERDRDKEQAR